MRQNKLNDNCQIPDVEPSGHDKKNHYTQRVRMHHALAKTANKLRNTYIQFLPVCIQ
jgi:hypothetical protein